MPKEFYLCLHGHFYQPPRENPWMEEIEIQESAAPFHDWNERIHHECYLPNARARVIDEKGNIVNIVNNFKKISFNFGPTLIAWIENKHPETYEHILEADRISCKEHHGHGNAIAQVYNHMIMPLANRRDKVTQVKWGLEDFRKRFGREPESIWLSETACNEETLEVVAGEGIKYLILEPHQAQAFRSLNEANWHDVSDGRIDPKQTYRCFLKNHPEKFIDIFFYDGPISRAMGFENLLFDSKLFMGRIENAEVDRDEPQLISLATDGETYGHHKAFGERVLAYATQIEAPKKEFRIVNYGEFLQSHPPQFAVRLKEGESGEGTSWSCAHGVKRWKDHCGCRGGGPGEWTQHWRKPLRSALDWLRDELEKIFEQRAAQYLKEPWSARNDYIQVILDRTDSNIKNFFARHAKFELNKEQTVICLKFLEMQRHAMLMYTSCGWFFTEISGIETVQIIEYAARAIQLALEVSGVSLEEGFLSRLAEAKCNVPEFRDGRWIYENWIKDKVLSLSHITAFYAITSVISEKYESKESVELYCFEIRILHQRKETFGDITLNIGRVRIRSRITLEESDLVFAAIHIGLYDFRCSVKLFKEEAELEIVEKEFFEELHSFHIVELLRRMDDVFGEKYFALKDLPLRERTQVIKILTREVIEKISSIHENLYDENRRISEIYRSINLPIPEQIRYAVELILSRRLREAIEQLAGHGFDPKKARPLYRLIEDARIFSIELKKKEVGPFLVSELEKRTSSLVKNVQPELVNECLNIQKLAKKIGIELEQSQAQEDLFFLLMLWTHDHQAIPESVRQSAPNLLQLFTDLRINAEELKKRIKST